MTAKEQSAAQASPVCSRGLCCPPRGAQPAALSCCPLTLPPEAGQSKEIAGETTLRSSSQVTCSWLHGPWKYTPFALVPQARQEPGG